MSMQVGGSKGGPMSDINVTPFIDVCLVLLIIFMVVVAVTMVQLGYLSKLPPRSTPGTMTPDTNQIVIRIKPPCESGQLYNCQVFINKDLIPVSKLMTQVRGIMAGKPATQMVFFSADDEVNYENAMKILDILYIGGAKNIGVLTEPIAAGIE